MRKAKPVYVETTIRTDMEQLWLHTQSPELHRQWDLRFSEIAYLPRREGESRQKFLYRTRIGFGLSIAGTGVTKAAAIRPGGERVSVLSFGSDQQLSLIRRGSGYWKYEPAGESIVFLTRFDYETRFGRIGRWFDALLFRPLFGYATAWSFDVLRIWLERRIPPASTIRQALVHYGSSLMLALLWLYEGLVPKLIFADAGEREVLRQAAFVPGREDEVLLVLGAAETVLAVAICLLHRRKWIFQLQSLLLIVLGAAALGGNPALLHAPFGPVALSAAMLGLGWLAAGTRRDLPDAGRCRRKPLRSGEWIRSNRQRGDAR